MSLNVNATSSAENGCPSLHLTPVRSLNVQLSPSDAVVQLSARSGAGARSFPGLVTPSKITRLMKSDSTNAFGLHGFSVGSDPIGIWHVFRPDLALRSEHVLCFIGVELRRYWLVAIHVLERVVAADALGLGRKLGLRMVHIRRLLRRHHDVMSSLRGSDPARLAAPAHHRRAGGEPALEDLVPTHEPAAALREPGVEVADEPAL